MLINRRGFLKLFAGTVIAVYAGDVPSSIAKLVEEEVPFAKLFWIDYANKVVYVNPKVKSVTVSQLYTFMCDMDRRGATKVTYKTMSDGATKFILHGMQIDVS